MNRLQLRKFGSTEELRAVATAWDDLWFRSEVTIPRARAHLVALWVDHFSPSATFQALAVEQEGRLVAALPLVGRRLKGLINVGALPSNAWATSGELLLDPATDIVAVLDLLVSAFDRLPWSLLLLRLVAFEQPHWQALQAAMIRAGLSVDVRQQYQAAQVEIGDDWQTYEATRTRNHRQSRRRQARKLEQEGNTKLKIYSEISPSQVDTLVLRGFEVENRSWKGTEGTSVLKKPGMLEFFRREAAHLAEWGQLELVFLEHRGQPIAFDYGFNSKGVHFTPKVGYDETYAKFGPGQQLMMRLLQRLHDDPQRRLIDFLGDPDPWKVSWATSTYPMGRIVTNTGRPLSQGLFHIYTNWQPRLRQFRQKLLAPTKSSLKSETLAEG